MSKNVIDEEQFTVEEVGEGDSNASTASISSPSSPRVRETKASAMKESLAKSQDSFVKYVKLETEYQNLHRALDHANNEKLVQEKTIKAKEGELLKLSLDFESARTKIDKLQDSIRLKDMENSNLTQEKKTLEELSALNQLSIKRQKDTETRTRKYVSVLPEDSLDRIIQLENELKIKDTTIGSLQNEIKTLRLLGGKKEKALEKVEKNLKDTEYKADRYVSILICLNFINRIYDLECRNSELIVQLEKANKEIKTLQEITKLKTKAVEALNEQVDKLKVTEEEYKDFQKKTSQLYKESEKTKKEIYMAQRSIESKDKEIFKLAQEKDTVPIKSLEGDKRYLQVIYKDS
jgi:chromosome segregation ATPase